MYGTNIQTDCYNVQQAYSWSKAFDFYLTNCASGYEAREAKYSQENEENTKSAQDLKIIYAHIIFK